MKAVLSTSMGSTAASPKSKLYHVIDGNRVIGPPDGLTGCVDGLYGRVTGLTGCVDGLYGCVTGVTGCVDGLYGRVTGLMGCVDGLYGCVTGLTGCVNDCELSESDRKKGVDIQTLVKKDC